MKKLIIAFMFLYGGAVVSQNKQAGDSLGLPGDNLNLYSVLDVFRDSPTLEAFEKSLNTENNKLNNLDLNNDDKIDYIKVLDSKDGDSHLITLQIEISKTEKQDVAVITVDKDANGKTKVQVVGDPELYGKDYIIEPNDDNAGKKQTASTSPNKSNKTSDTTVSADGKTVIINNTTNNYYNSDNGNQPTEDVKPVPPVNQWVIVNYIYSPGYVVYASPWYWGYYPGWWNPWKPLFWHHYYWHYHHHHFYHHHYYYHHAPFFYSKTYPKYYAERRSVSANYTERKNTGTFKKTYSRPDLGKPPVGRPNPAYNNDKPGKNVAPVKPMKPGNVSPVKPAPNKQPMQMPKSNPKPPVIKSPPKGGVAPAPRPSGGNSGGGRRH